MIDKIQLTLYEVFGYFLPGAVAALALLIAWWAVFLSDKMIPIHAFSPNAVGWVVLVGLSYLAGHIVQGLGNRFLRGAEEAALGSNGSLSKPIREKAFENAARLIGADMASMGAAELFRFCDEYSLQKGELGDRDIFVYREGFYKGCTIAFLMLSIALALRGAIGHSVLALCADPKLAACLHVIPRKELFTAAVVVALFSGICRKRFHRFGNYRVTRAVFAFLALTGLDNKGEKNA